MRLAFVVMLALLGIGIATVVPPSPLQVAAPAAACELRRCVPHDPVCWGPHEDPTCI